MEAQHLHKRVHWDTSATRAHGRRAAVIGHVHDGGGGIEYEDVEGGKVNANSSIVLGFGAVVSSVMSAELAAHPAAARLRAELMDASNQEEEQQQQKEEGNAVKLLRQQLLLVRILEDAGVCYNGVMYTGLGVLAGLCSVGVLTLSEAMALAVAFDSGERSVSELKRFMVMEEETLLSPSNEVVEVTGEDIVSTMVGGVQLGPFFVTDPSGEVVVIGVNVEEEEEDEEDEDDDQKKSVSMDVGGSDGDGDDDDAVEVCVLFILAASVSETTNTRNKHTKQQIG